MMTKVLRFALLLLLAAPAYADETLSISGTIAKPLKLTVAELAAMPQTEMAVSFINGKGKEEAVYKGPLLWAVLQRVALTDKQKNAALHHSLLVRSSDDYVITMSLAELDPDYGNAQVIVALTRDNVAISDGGMRLIVGGDKHGGRAVRKLAAVEIK